MESDRPLLSAALRLAYYSGLAGAALGAWLVRLNPQDAQRYGGQVEVVAQFAKEQSWVVVMCPIIAGLAKAALDRLAQRWTRRILHSLLTDYRANLFVNRAGARHHHRVTLFVWRRVCFWRTWPWCRKRWPWSGWLVPVVRSDHTTQRVRARFLAPDQADRCEGVVGSTWSHQATVTVTDLPGLTKDSDESDIRAYRDKTKCNERWLRSRLADGETLPRSLRGLPIEVNDELRGVVVIDSRDPTGFEADPDGAANFTLIFSSTIGRLLERARI